MVPPRWKSYGTFVVAWVAAASAVDLGASDDKGLLGDALLIQTADVPDTIHTIPHVVPNGEYDSHLKRIYRQSQADQVNHQEKLEQENKKLRKKVKALSAALGNEEARRAEAQQAQQQQAQEASSQAPAQESAGVESSSEVVAVGGASFSKAVGQVVCYLLVGGVILGAEVFVLTQSPNVTVKAKTWSTIENIVAIFVAVLWFQAVDDIFQSSSLSKTWLVVGAVLHAIAIFALFVFLAWQLRAKDKVLWTVTACGGHYIGFIGIHASGTLQASWFSEHLGMCFLSIVVILLFLGGASFATHRILEREAEQARNKPEEYERRKKFVEKIEELEDDVGGMVLAFVWTMFVRYLVGQFYATLEEGEPGPPQHTWQQRAMFLLYTCLMGALAMYLLPVLQQKSGKMTSNIANRLLLLLQPFLTMSVAWAILLWADWQFYEAMFNGRPVLGRIIFALLCGAVVGGLVFLFGVLTKRQIHAHRRGGSDPQMSTAARHADLSQRLTDLERRKFILSMVALVTAFSWEETLDQALEGFTEGTGHAVMLKIFVATLLTAVLGPVYVLYIRPLVEVSEVAEDKELDLE